MAIAPLRPPNQTPGGRPPRGHRRVATRRRTDLRTQLTAAAQRLRTADAPELAEAVDQVLAPGGWIRLRETDVAADSGTSPSMSVLLTASGKEQIVARAEEAGNVLTHDVNEGFAKFLAGDFAPRPFRKASPGTGEARDNLNVRPSKTLRDKVIDRGEKPSRIAAEYLMFKYEVGPYAPGFEGARPRGAMRNPQVPRSIRDRIRAAQEKAGRLVTDDVEEGLDAYLAGTFTPEAPVWSAEDSGDMVNLKMNPNDALYSDAAAAGDLRPAQVAIAYLLHKYKLRPSK